MTPIPSIDQRHDRCGHSGIRLADGGNGQEVTTSELVRAVDVRLDASGRLALERHHVETAVWWERQLTLCLLGAVLEFGWEKALGDDEELGWWCDRAAEGIAAL